MRTRNPQFRRLLGQEFNDVIEIRQARADIERLPAAIALTPQRLAHDDRIERRDVGAHGKPVDRWRGDQRQFAHARQRQLQRARDRRRRQRQHMHVLAQLLEPLLVRDAEVLLFVDDEQAEPRKLDLLAEQRMRADDDIDLAALQCRPWCRQVPSASPCATPARCSPAIPRSGSRRSGSAGARAASSAPRPPPGSRRAPPPAPRATPLRSCQSRHRRRPGGPSAGRS